MLEGRPLEIDGDQRGLRRLKLGLRGDDVGARRHAGRVLVLGNGEAALEALDVLLQHALERILVAELEIIRRQFRLEAETDQSEVGGRGLGRGDVALDLPADAAEQVELPARLPLERDGGALGAERPGADDARCADHRGKQGGAGLRHEGTSLIVDRDLGAEILVVHVDGPDQAIEGGILEDAPPVAALGRVVRARRAPALLRLNVGEAVLPRAALLEAEGRLDGGTRVVGADEAAGGQRRDRGDGGEAEQEPGPRPSPTLHPQGTLPRGGGRVMAHVTCHETNILTRRAPPPLRPGGASPRAGDGRDTGRRPVSCRGSGSG